MIVFNVTGVVCDLGGFVSIQVNNKNQFFPLYEFYWCYSKKLKPPCFLLSVYSLSHSLPDSGSPALLLPAPCLGM